jgi:hypothetical protein
MNLLFNDYTILSLGFNCNIKKYIDKIRPNSPTQFFDYIGTSMWGINELIRNNFSDIFNIDEFENMKTNIYYGEIATNKKYYLRFFHDLKNVENNNTKILNYNNNIHVCKKNNFDECKEKYERRSQRFIELLNSSNKILFIRLQENINNIIKHDMYKDKYKKSELEYTFELSNTLKNMYPKLEFIIITISNNQKNEFYKDKNIIVLEQIENITNYETCDIILEKLFDTNKNFIINCITNNI